METVDIILRRIPYLMPYGFPENYLKEKLREVIPNLPIFRINNLFFTLEARSGNLYVEYLFGEHAGVKDVVKTYAFLGVLARKLGYRYIFGDAAPERVKSYERISAEPTLLWRLPVFLSPVRYMPGDARARIKAPIGSIRLDIFRAFYVVNLEDVDVRSLTSEELEEYGEWLVDFVKEAGAVVFFGNALTIIELGRWLRHAGIPVAEDGIKEHYSLTFLVKRAWEIPILKKYASKEDILNEAKIVMGGKEYEFRSPDTVL